MTLASQASREARPGGRWSAPDLLTDLLRLAALERTVAHLIAGWVPKVPDLDDKLAIAAGFEDAMVRASALRQHALALLERDERGLTADLSWTAPLRELDRCADHATVVDSLLGDIPSFLLERYRELEGGLDPLLDTRLIATVSTAIGRLASTRLLILVIRRGGVGFRTPSSVAQVSALTAASAAANPTHGMSDSG